MYEDSYYADNEIDRVIYQYYRENGGYFLGNPYAGQYPHCQLILDMDSAPVSVLPVVTSQSNYGYGVTCAAMTQAELKYPYHLDIVPMTFFKKGMELIAKADIKVRYRDLDSKYLIKSDEPAFTKLILPGSRLADLLLQTKAFRIKVEPVAKERNLHAVQVFRNRTFGVEIQGKRIDFEELTAMVEICREAAAAVKSFAMPEKEER